MEILYCAGSVWLLDSQLRGDDLGKYILRNAEAFGYKREGDGPQSVFVAIEQRSKQRCASGQ